MRSIIVLARPLLLVHCTIFHFRRVPQVLYHLGAIKYSVNLMEILKAGKLLTPGERLEVEIRGCTLWAVEVGYCQHNTEIPVPYVVRKRRLRTPVGRYFQTEYGMFSL